jgi:transcriptional regulator with XRE-family HTH domain
MATEPGNVGSFGALLRAARERAGLSQSALARKAGLDPSFINRLESGQRSADRAVATALVAALGLGDAEGDRLLAAGGHLPAVFARLGLQDPTLQLVARILADERLSAEDRAAFRQAIELIGRRWGAVER